MLEGKTALVTGGAGHIGYELCRDMLINGARVVILDLDSGKSLEAINHLEKETGGKASYLEIDLGQPGQIEAVKNRLDSLGLQPDVLVNNAAFYGKMPGWGVAFEREGIEAWMKVFQINAAAPFFLVQGLAELLRGQPDASVINVSSIYSLTGPDHRLYEGTDMTNPCAYAASKAALNQITRWLATTLAPDIRVNTVTMGGVARGQPPAFVQAYESRTPLKRMAEERDVSGAVTFLASNRASYITGQNLAIDGGWTAW